MTDEAIEDGVSTTAPPAGEPEGAPAGAESLTAVHDAINRVAGQARAAADAANAQAADLYDRIVEVSKEAASKVGPFVEEQTYVSIGLAAMAGLVLGVLLGSRGPRVVVIRDRD